LAGWGPRLGPFQGTADPGTEKEPMPENLKGKEKILRIYLNRKK